MLLSFSSLGKYNMNKIEWLYILEALQKSTNLLNNEHPVTIGINQIS